MTTFIPDDFPADIKKKLQSLEAATEKNNAAITAYKTQLTANDYRMALEATGQESAKYNKSSTLPKLPPNENSFFVKYKTYIIAVIIVVIIGIAYFIFKKK